MHPKRLRVPPSGDGTTDEFFSSPFLVFSFSHCSIIAFPISFMMNMDYLCSNSYLHFLKSCKSANWQDSVLLEAQV